MSNHTHILYFICILCILCILCHLCFIIRRSEIRIMHYRHHVNIIIVSKMFVCQTVVRCHLGQYIMYFKVKKVRLDAVVVTGVNGR